MKLMEPRELRRLARVGVAFEMARLTALMEQLSEPEDRVAIPRRSMSAAAKKAISKRMKAYWREKRKGAK